MSGLETLQDLFTGLARRGTEPAVVAFTESGQRVWSGEDLTESARRLAGGLIDRDIGRNRPVALMAPNSPEWVACFWGLVIAGCTVMPLDRQMGDEERRHCLEHSGCRCIFTGAEDLAWFEDTEFEVYLLDGAEDDPRSWRALFGNRITEPPEVRPEDRACLLFTSGTTGLPKGVPLTHANLTANIAAVVAERIIGAGDRLLLPLPLHHAYPLTVGLLTGLAAGASVIFPQGLGGPQLVEATSKGKATAMLAVPRLYTTLLDGIRARAAAAPGPAGALFDRLFRLSVTACRRWHMPLGKLLFRSLRNRIGPKLRLLASGGARLEPDVAWGLEALGWTVLSGYGLTETAPILTFNSPRARNLESAGRPLPGVDLRIAAEEGKQEGEVQAQGANVFGGYLDNPEATGKCFTEDGWFRTGDVGYFDDGGFLHLVSRGSDLIVLADGKNIIPEEVEKVYLESRFIQEMAVIERKGLLVGIVVPNVEAIREFGATRMEQLMREEVDNASARLPRYRRVHGYVLWRDPLPRNPLGKLRRHLLGDIYEEARSRKSTGEKTELSEEDRKFLEETGVTDLWAWLQERFPDQTLSLETSPQMDLDLDSLGWLNLTIDIDERFGVRLGDEAVSRITSLRHLLQEVAEACGGDETEEARRLSSKEADWIAPQTEGERRAGRLIHGLSRLLAAILFRQRTEGLENLPEHGPFILAVNHLSYLDPPCLYAALPRGVVERTYFAGWTGIMFRNRLMRWGSRATRTFPVNADRGAGQAIAFGTELLERGDAMVLFPEGRVSASGELLDFQPGIGLLAQRTEVPIIPAHISGTYEAMPRGWRLKRLAKVQLIIGEPLDTARLLADSPKERPQQYVADQVRKAVERLGEEQAD